MASLRSIIVTGANQGLGYHTVHQLASKPNVLVFLGSRKLAAAEEAIKTFAPEIHQTSTVVPVQLDITDAKSINTARDFISENLKKHSLSGLDVLVNNAAVLVPDFAEVYAVNVVGTANFTADMRPLLNKNATIINVSSQLGSLHDHLHRQAQNVFPAYNSSKAALNQLTLIWAIEEEEKKSGVRVVSTCPGYNTTAMNAYAGTMHPSEGRQIIVKTALETEGKSGTYFNKDGPLEW
ncbi:hypothetical protein C8F01DRAFT_1153568 [Mycena amicta]|nr:hypothetical protein C8F01DRAFT_1153568 [Mycena amicta]